MSASKKKKRSTTKGNKKATARVCKSVGDPLSGLHEAMTLRGIEPPTGGFQLNGTIQKFRGDASSKRKKGWYIGWWQPRPLVVWGCWTRFDCEKQTWRVGVGTPLSAEEEQTVRLRLKKARRKFVAERIVVRTAARKRAARFWKKAIPATLDHPYLREKGVKAHGLRQSNGRLLVPLHDVGGTLHSLQFIGKPGELKPFLFGGRVKGCYFPLGKIDGKCILIAEGFATGASLHESTGIPVAVAFSAYNLKPVAQALRKRFPTADIVIASDNDTGKELEGKPNTGLVLGRAAALSVNARWTYPEFGGRVDQGSDFNDLAAKRGLAEVRSAVDSAAFVPVWPPSHSSSANPYTDLSNAYRLVTSAGADLMFVRGVGWHYWKGPWKPCAAGAEKAAAGVGRLVADEAAQISKAAADCHDETLRSDLLRQTEARLRWTKTSERASNIDSTLRLAQRLLSTEPATLDAFPWRFGCPNGVVDLRTGGFRAHERTDFITKLAGCEFDPDATAPRWLRFLREIFSDDKEVITFVQRLLGYCLLGTRKEQVLLVFVGSGANGKTTLLNTSQHVMGDYATTAPSNLLLNTQGDRHPTELMNLFGRRLVVCTESPKDGRLNEERVKSLTGGDVISARRMRQDFVTFRPTHQLILQTNHLPHVRDTDHGFWRRVRVVHFTETFSGKRVDRELEDKLQCEASGILNWLVQGARRYLQVGLREPKSIRSATEVYRTSQDSVGSFILEKCNRDAKATIGVRELRNAYSAWCKQNEEKEVSTLEFAQRLDDLGFPAKRKNTARLRCGLGLRK